MFSVLRNLFLLVSLGLLTAIAHAQSDASQPWEKFNISVGGFLTESDTTVQVNSQTFGIGAVIDLENTLGVERDFRTYRIDTLYRFGESRRHEVEFHYFNSKRTGDRTLDQDLQIGDIFLPAGTGVATEFSLRFANLDYVYNFLMDDRVRLGVSAGLHTTGVKFKIAETGGGTKTEDESFTAPLPMLGLRSEVLLTPRWRLRTDLNFFYLEYDRYTGRLADALFTIEYRPWKRFGLGAGINAVNYSVEADADASLADLNGEIEFSLTGIMLYGKYFF